MNLISIDRVTKSQGDKKLFENISFGIDEGQKIALIGVNGSGKSTLMKLVSGQISADTGTISKNKDAKICFLEQVPASNPDDTILDHIFKSDNPKITLIKKYEMLCAQVAHAGGEELQHAMSEAVLEMNRNDAWQFEAQIKAILDRFGISDLGQKMGALSGGMLKKVALAQVLINDFNLILLDEPTNHLDVTTIEWLEQYLQKSNKAMVLVTHDRYFLDSVCNVIYEIMPDHTLLRYDGNYSYYLEKKAEIENSMLREEERVKTILRNELMWLGRGAKARSTKQKARIDRIHEMQAREFRTESTIELGVATRKLGKKILELKNVSKSYGGKLVIKPFSFLFDTRQKIGIIGPNGSGKTTFLNILTGRINSDTGEIDRGFHTHFGYFDQHSAELDPNMRLIEFIKKAGETIKLADGCDITASAMLERFLFPSILHYTPIGKLSGGEKRRLYLLHVLMKNPNFLVLDEPTNDLDIKTLAILEDFLTDFGGCILIASHDRYFLDRIAETLLIFDGSGEIKGYVGNYSEYMEYKKLTGELEKSAAEESARNEKKSVSHKPAENKDKCEKKKLSFNEKREYENILGEIEKLESEKNEIENLLCGNETDYNKLNGWIARQKELESEIAAKIARWEYLESIASLSS